MKNEEVIERMQELEMKLSRAESTLADQLHLINTHRMMLIELKPSELDCYLQDAKNTLDTFDLDQLIQYREIVVKIGAHIMSRMQALSDTKGIQSRIKERDDHEKEKVRKIRETPKPIHGRKPLSDEAKMIAGLWKTLGPALKKEQLVAEICGAFPNLSAEKASEAIEALNVKAQSKSN